LLIQIRGFRRITSHDLVVAAEGTMQSKKAKAADEDDLFLERLEHIVDLKHELVQLGDKIEWNWIDREIAQLCSEKRLKQRLRLVRRRKASGQGRERPSLRANGRQL
jgi:hypothetical protein